MSVVYQLDGDPGQQAIDRGRSGFHLNSNSQPFLSLFENHVRLVYITLVLSHLNNVTEDEVSQLYLCM